MSSDEVAAARQASMTANWQDDFRISYQAAEKTKFDELMNGWVKNHVGIPPEDLLRDLARRHAETIVNKVINMKKHAPPIRRTKTRR